MLISLGAVLALPAGVLARDFNVGAGPARPGAGPRAAGAAPEDPSPPADDTPDAIIIAISSSPVVEVHDVASRGIRVGVLLEAATEPVAVVVLFAGGRGAPRISDKDSSSSWPVTSLSAAAICFWSRD